MGEGRQEAGVSKYSIPPPVVEKENFLQWRVIHREHCFCQYLIISRIFNAIHLMGSSSTFELGLVSGASSSSYE